MGRRSLALGGKFTQAEKFALVNRAMFLSPGLGDYFSD